MQMCEQSLQVTLLESCVLAGKWCGSKQRPACDIFEPLRKGLDCQLGPTRSRTHSADEQLVEIHGSQHTLATAICHE